MLAPISRWFAVAAAVLLTLGLTSCSTPPGDPSSATAARSAARADSTASPAPTISSGDHGMVSSAVVAENRRLGTTGWRITHQTPGAIQGFADHDYAQAGDAVGLYVTTAQRTFSAAAYRMGWYGGTGARQVWRSPVLRGIHQSGCDVDGRTNLVSCTHWTRDTTMPITADFPPGDYLIKLTAADGNQSYIPLTIWSPASRATYLVMNRSLVEQGWNDYGGFDFYAGQGPCILDTNGYPPCNRARAVSFDRPYSGDGANDYLVSEYPMVQFMEQQGLDVAYCTDICISEHPGFLLQHRALIGLDHDETWTNSERVGVIAAAAAGVNLAFFGAATLVRHARLEASALGTDRVEVDYRDAAEDPASQGGNPWEVTGNQWTSSPGGWNPQSLLGQVYSGYLAPGRPDAAMTVLDAGSWLFHGTGLAAGASIPSVINSDIEHIDPAGPTPPNLQVLAHSAIPASDVFTGQGLWNGYTYSDVTYYTGPGGAGVFDSGDNIWVSKLLPCPSNAPGCPSRAMRQMTANVLRLFGTGPAARVQPSRANWQTVTPPGS